MTLIQHLQTPITYLNIGHQILYSVTLNVRDISAQIIIVLDSTYILAYSPYLARMLLRLAAGGRRQAAVASPRHIAQNTEITHYE